MAKLYDITKKYPFIYEVDDELLHIGMGRFGVCTNHLAKGYYYRYKEEVGKIGRENIRARALNEEEYNNLIYFFKKVKNYSEESIDGKLIGEIHRKIYLFIDELEPTEKQNLLEQLLDFEKVFEMYFEKEIRGI